MNEKTTLSDARKLQSQIKEKKLFLRSVYGGMMSATDLANELGLRRDHAKEWGVEHGAAFRVGNRVKYDTDVVARVIVLQRGFV